MLFQLHSLCLAAALLAPAFSSLAAIDLDAKVPVGPQTRIGKLPNGLSYYIRRHPQPEHRLELRLVVKAGSVLEDEDQQGLAHVVEHMAFNGSAHFKRFELVSWLQSIGVNYGPDLNAYTSYDETVYILPVPTGDRKNVDQAFTILEDWAHGVRFDDADIDKERDVVLEEARLRKGLGERIGNAVNPKVFNGSLYGARAPIGKEDVIRHFKPDALRRFYRDWYRPDLMAVVAVGDIDPDEAERLIKAHFAGLQNPAQERERRYPEIRPFATTGTLTITDPEATLNSIALHYPARYAPDPGTYGGYRDLLLDRLFNQMFNGRLSELAQQAKAPFIGANGGLARLTPSYETYYANVTPGAGGSAPALTALLQEQLRVRRDGFTQAELDRARKIELRHYENYYNQRDAAQSSEYAAEYLRNFLAGEAVPGREAEYWMVRELLPAIRLDDVNAYARRKAPGADAAKLVVYVGGTHSGSAPDEATLLAQVSAAEHAPAAARAEKALPDRLMERPALPGRIVEESRDQALGLTRLTLSNGIQVILKPLAFGHDQVLMAARRHGGQRLFGDADIQNARYASDIAGSMGVKDYTPFEVTKILSGRAAHVNMWLGSDTDEITGDAGSNPDDIEAMLQMLWLRMAGVRRDDTLFRAYIDSQREFLRHREDEPQVRFNDAVMKALYGSHPYAPRAARLEDLDKVDLDRSIALYRQRFSSARGMTFVLVGSFDVDRIKPLLAAYLGTLPVTDLPLASRDVGVRLARGVVRQEVVAGTEPKSTVALSFTGPMAWSPADSLRLQMLVELMNLRIVDVLRQKLGLVYAGQVSGSMNTLPYPYYGIDFSLPTGPEKVDRMLAAVFDEIARMKAEGPSTGDLEKVKQSWRLGHAQGLGQNGYWLNELTDLSFERRDLHRILTIMDEANALGVNDIRDAARRFLDTGNYVQVVLNPERKTLAAGAH
jgi:zinc protease